MRTFVVKSLEDGHTLQLVQASTPQVALNRAACVLHREDHICGLYSKTGRKYYGTLNLVPVGTSNHYSTVKH